MKSFKMKAFKIAWRDISKIFKNRFIRVSVTAIIIVPLLYSLLYLAAFWDPYSRLQDMPVAVVNLDKGGVLEGSEVNYGMDIADKLKNNPKVGWRFVSREDADKGTVGQKYYAEFVIPENFTESLLKARDGKPLQPEILFRSNEKRNFLAAQINGKVMSELKAEIVKNISEQYTEVTFDSLNELKDGLVQAADGSGELKDGITEAAEGSGKLMDGLSQLKNKLPEMVSGVTSLFDGSKSLNQGLYALNSGNETLTQKLGGARDGAKSIDNCLGQLKDGLSLLNEGINTQAKDEKGSPLGLKSGAEALSGGVNQLNQGLNTEAVDEKGNPLGLKAGAEALYQGISSLSVGLNTNSTDSNGNPLGLKNGGDRLYMGLTHDDSDPSKDGIGPSLKNLQGLLDAYKLTGNQAYMDQAQLILGELVHQTNESSSNPANPTFLDGMNSLKSGIALASTGAQRLLVGAQGVKEGTAKAADSVKLQLVPGAEGIKNGVNKVSDALLNQILPGMAQLKIGTNNLAVGMDAAVEGSSQLKDGSKSLYEGSSLLNEGLGTLYGSMPELSKGVEALGSGSSSLNNGMIRISEGIRELSDKLSEGADELKAKLVNDSKTMGEFISNPVSVNESPVNPVKNYGTGFTPYFIPLSLWVGALMMFFVISERVDDDINVGNASLIIGKFLSYGYIGILQAVLASIIVLALGLSPQNIPMYFLFNIFMSFVFIAIIQSLIFLLGDAGRLLAIVLLILQLTASAGTFPLEVVPSFFKVLNPFMPFTYCVSGLREIISGTDYSILFRDVFVLGVTMIVFLIISILMKGHADRVKMRVKENKVEKNMMVK